MVLPSGTWCQTPDMENFALTVDRRNVLCYQFTLTQVIVKHRLQHYSVIQSDVKPRPT